MYPFPQSVNPAVSSHLDAQIAFFNKLSQTMSHSFQQVVQLNMQLSQTMLEEVANAGQCILTTERPTDAMSLAASRAQTANDKLRAYHQQLSRLAASAQVDLTRVTEEHVQETSRTARALADEVTRAAAEETDKSMRQQEETLKNFRDPFKQEGTRGSHAGAQFQGNLQSSGDEANADASVKVAGQGGKVSAQGNMQGNPAQQPGNKSPGPAR
jgi:phasin family protein